jgi:hypothetical protein
LIVLKWILIFKGGLIVKSSCRSLSFVFILIFVLAAVGSRAESSADSLDFSQYEFSQFVVSAGLLPQNVINLDNNGAIVLLCRNGRTREEIQAYDSCLAESQLVLMEQIRVLDHDGDTYKTAFPILDRKETVRLRATTAKAAIKMADELKDEIRQFSDILSKSGRQKNAFTILFSYVMDDLVWDIWEKKGVLPVREITAEKPFWAGVVWAIRPPRDFSCGTNTISDQGVALKVNWSQPAMPKMMPFVSDWKNLVAMLDDYIQYGKVVTESAKEVFAPFDLFDKDGEFTIPLITEKQGDPLYDQCRRMAETIANRVPSILDLPAIVKDFSFRDKNQALVIAYHELMWDMLDVLSNSGLASRPKAFVDPSGSIPKDIASLVFIVRKN